MFGLCLKQSRVTKSQLVKTMAAWRNGFELVLEMNMQY